MLHTAHRIDASLPRLLGLCLLALLGCGTPEQSGLGAVKPEPSRPLPPPPRHEEEAPRLTADITQHDLDTAGEAGRVQSEASAAAARDQAASGPPAPRAERKDAQPARPKARHEAPLDALLNGALSAPAAASSGDGRGAAGRVSRRKRALGALGTIGHGAGGGGLALAPPALEFHTESYAHRQDNDFQKVADKPLSTFSIDVDTASYANVRRFLTDGSLPPADAVRIEEMVNYFDYDYPAPRGDEPFAVHTEIAAAPWNPEHRLLHVGLQGREIDQRQVPARNLVFLIDVSGSMHSPDKLPLLVRGLSMLTRNLRTQDRIAVAVYAGASGVVLPPTSGRHQGRILAALEQLRAGGSTNGADGIRLAYRLAREHFVKGGINRVILATDGDFNVGVTSEGELTRLIEKERESGVFLTVLGFGTGNLKDSTMELLADKGNGNYAYIDSDDEAHKVLVREAGSTLMTIAKDVKLQIEFNPALVESYRLIGYENRVLADRDFNDDKKDAGEIGAGHTVTALYEVVLRRAGAETAPDVDPLRYQHDRALKDTANTRELATLKLRYKAPDGDVSRLESVPVEDAGLGLAQAGTDFRFAAAVAGFGMLLRGSEARGQARLAELRLLAQSALGTDPHGDRAQLLQLMHAAAKLGVDG